MTGDDYSPEAGDAFRVLAEQCFVVVNAHDLDSLPQVAMVKSIPGGQRLPVPALQKDGPGVDGMSGHIYKGYWFG